MLKSKNNKKIPETQNAWAESTCSAVVSDVQLGFLREFVLYIILSFEIVGQFQLLRGLTWQDGLISNTTNLCLAHEEQQPGSGVRQSPSQVPSAWEGWLRRGAPYPAVPMAGSTAWRPAEQARAARGQCGRA